MRITAINEKTVPIKSAVFEPFGGFADGVPVEKGLIPMPDVPGIGIELKADLTKIFQSLV